MEGQAHADIYGRNVTQGGDVKKRQPKNWERSINKGGAWCINHPTVPSSGSVKVKGKTRPICSVCSGRVMKQMVKMSEEGKLTIGVRKP